MTQEIPEGFLDQLAAATPTPGGGAAAALAGALSAALATMACRVTALRGSPFEALGDIERESEALRDSLTALVRRDSEAFGAVIAAGRAPERERRRALRDALVGAIDVPVEIARAAGRVLELCDQLAARTRSSTVSDLGVAVALAGAALEGAVLTARVNLRHIGDDAFAAHTAAILARLMDDATATRRRLARAVADRTGIPA